LLIGRFGHNATLVMDNYTTPTDCSAFVIYRKVL
jgi:hypothetical protein